MNNQTFAFSSEQTLIVTVIQGNLQVKGWERSELLVKAEASSQANVIENSDHQELSCAGDCIVRLPYESQVNVQLVEGNARFKLVEGVLQVEAVRGNLAVRNCGPTRIGSVSGDLLVRQLRGELEVERCGGNAAVRDIQGGLEMTQISGNLDVRDAEGDLRLTVGGNARLNLCQLLGTQYRVSAGGNLHIQLPEENDLQATFTSGSGRIEVVAADRRKLVKSSRHELTLGDGTAQMELIAGGNIHFSCEEGRWEGIDDLDAELETAFEGLSEAFRQNLTAQIENQIDSHVEMINEKLSHLDDSLAQSGMSQEEIERLRRRAQDAAEKASSRAEEQMRRAQEKMERKLAAAQRKAELRARAAERRRGAHRAGPESFSWSRSRTEPSAPASSEEERLLILSMLGEKKITVEQAEKLLAALEGK